MKTKLKWSALATVLLILTLASAFNKSANADAKPNMNDSTLAKSKTREVLTSQQLFITKLDRIRKDRKGNNAKVTAESKDAFQVVCYDVDSGRIELDWVMCTENENPKAGLYYPGTIEYRKLDDLIIKIKTRLAKKAKL